MQTRLAWPPFTRNLQISLVGLLILWIVGVEFTAFVQEYMLVSKSAVFEQGQIWTLLTYSVFHFDFSHLMFNGIALWLFGGEIDQRWGDRWFWAFCAITAVGGGVTVVLAQLVFGTNFPTLGYSGAVMGLVAAYSWHNWNRPLYFFFVKMTGKWLLPFFVFIDVMLVVGARQPISIAGHLGGMITGLLLVSGYWRPTRLKRAIKRWKTRRKFRNQSRSPDNDRRWN